MISIYGKFYTEKPEEHFHWMEMENVAVKTEVPLTEDKQQSRIYSSKLSI